MVQCYQRWSRGNLAVIESLANFFEYIVTNTVTDLRSFQMCKLRTYNSKTSRIICDKNKKNLVDSTLENLCMGTIARNKEDNVI